MVYALKGHVFKKNIFHRAVLLIMFYILCNILTLFLIVNK